MIEIFKWNDILKNVPAGVEEIKCIETSQKWIIPECYKALLLYTNGFSIAGGTIIYGLDEIEERNETLEVEQYAKGYIAIGDDGGGLVFMMKQELENKEVVIVDSGDLDITDPFLKIDNLNEWIATKCKLNQFRVDDDNSSYSRLINVVMTTKPKNGSKDLIKIKIAMNLEMSMSELLRGMKNLPYTIIHEMPYGKALKVLESVEMVGDIFTIEEC